LPLCPGLQYNFDPRTYRERLFTVACFLTGREVFAGFTLVIDAPAHARMPGATPVFIAGVTGIGKNDTIRLTQQFGQFSDVGNIRRRGGHGVYRAGIDISTDMNFHPKIPLVTVLGLMPIRVTDVVFVFGGRWCVNNRGVNQSALGD